MTSLRVFLLMAYVFSADGTLGDGSISTSVNNQTNHSRVQTSKSSGAARSVRSLGAKKPMARMDARVAVEGDDSKERIPSKTALFSADLDGGEIVPPDPDSFPGLSDYQRERLRCRDSDGGMHQLGAKYLTVATECTYYECEYNADINGASWMLNRDIFKCCFEDKYGYKEDAVMQGRCTKKVCVRDGEDNQVNGSLAWEVRTIGCAQCAIGLVMLERNETFHTGDPCRHFECGIAGKLEPAVDTTCCQYNDTLIGNQQLVMTSVENSCEVATCVDGEFTNHTQYRKLITVDEWISGCPVYWSQIQGTCYMSFTRPRRLADAVGHCRSLAPARNSQMMPIDFGGMIGTMSDVMELGRWYWLMLRTRPDSPRFMWDNTTTPERALVGHHDDPAIKKVNKWGKLTFQAAENQKNAYVCQMDHKPACMPVNYKPTEPSPKFRQPHEEF